MIAICLSYLNTSLEDFVIDNDRHVFGQSHATSSKAQSLLNLSDLVNIQIINSFKSLQDLYSHIDKVDLLHSEHVRPSWDAYFMVSPR
jgi:dCMP deaminase